MLPLLPLLLPAAAAAASAAATYNTNTNANMLCYLAVRARCDAAHTRGAACFKANLAPSSTKQLSRTSHISPPPVPALSPACRATARANSTRYAVIISYTITNQVLTRHVSVRLSENPTFQRLGPRTSWFCVSSTILLVAYITCNSIPVFEDLTGVIGAVSAAPICKCDPTACLSVTAHAVRTRER